MSLKFLGTIMSSYPHHPQQTPLINASTLNSLSGPSSSSSSFLRSSISPLSLGLTITLTVGLGLIPLLYFHFRSYASPKRKPPSTALPSFFYPAITSHGRQLPVTAKNSFSYTVLYMAVDIDSLEAGSLDLPFRVMGYGGKPSSKILGLRTKKYLGPGNEGFRAKIEDVLRRNGLPTDDLGRIWLLTMPSYMGYEGDNPLTTWFLYSKPKNGAERGELWGVILEVHNSFHESHCYVLPKDSSYRHDPAPGYDIAFTFPRSFHVSPFNSRDSCYRVDLHDPFSHPSNSPTPPEPLSTFVPRIKIFIRLYTSYTSEAENKVKFLATLRPSTEAAPVPLEPYSTFTVLRTLAKWPFTLLSVLLRTYYQAYRLHYLKRLAVYARPEIRAKGSENLYNSPGDDPGAAGVDLQKQDDSWIEAKAKRVIIRWAVDRAKQVGYDLEVNFSDRRETFSTSVFEGDSQKKEDTLVIHTADSLFFTNLIIAPSPQHMLAIATERITAISSDTQFMNFFSPPSTSSSSADNDIDMISHFTAKWRNKYWLNQYAQSKLAPLPSIPPLSSAHFSASSKAFTQRERIDIARITFWYVFGELSEQTIFDWISARFVPDQEPWKMWERSMKRVWGVHEIKGEENGSVLLDHERREVLRV
ncbi:hypothetical protein IAT40_000133 [Kwoniella sp. CBS 6097]